MILFIFNSKVKKKIAKTHIVISQLNCFQNKWNIIIYDFNTK